MLSMIAKAFPPKTCLIMGSATEDYQVVVRTPALNYSAGATRQFFKFENGEGSTARRTQIKTSETASTNMSRPEERFTL
jgi:hypothetical protein